MDPTLVAIVAAAIGAGGAVCAQTVSAIFTGRRERSHFAQTQEFERYKLFLDTRRTLFVKIASILQELGQSVNDLHGQSQVTSNIARIEIDRQIAELRSLEPELLVSSPNLASDVRLVINRTTDYESDRLNDDMMIKQRLEARGALHQSIRATIVSMQSALGIEALDDTARLSETIGGGMMELLRRASEDALKREKRLDRKARWRKRITGRRG